MKVRLLFLLAGPMLLGGPSRSLGAELPGVGVKLLASAAKPKMAEGEAEPDGSFPRIGYREEAMKGLLNIEPTLIYGEKEKDYVAQLKKGGPVGPITFSSPDYDVLFPAIDVRVVNNGKTPLHLSRVDIAVSASRPDPTPLPLIFGGYSEVQHILLFNEGWGRIDKAEFAFDLVAKEPRGKPSEDQPFRRTLQRVTERAVLGLHDELEKKGVSPELVAVAREYREIELKIEALEASTLDKAALEENPAQIELLEKQGKLSERLLALAETGCGPFGKGKDEYGQPDIQCWLQGWMTVFWQEGDEARHLRIAVICPVLLIPPDGLGANGPVMGSYETMLAREGDNYTLQVPVSHVVKPGGIARFDVTLGVPETSRHEFAVTVMMTDGVALDAGRVRLAALLPRAAAAAMKSRAEKPAE